MGRRVARASRPYLMKEKRRAGRPSQCAMEAHISAGESPALLNRGTRGLGPDRPLGTHLNFGHLGLGPRDAS
jgi:hypothetical protein